MSLLKKLKMSGIVAVGTVCFSAPSLADGAYTAFYTVDGYTSDSEKIPVSLTSLTGTIPVTIVSKTDPVSFKFDVSMGLFGNISAVIVSNYSDIPGSCTIEISLPQPQMWTPTPPLPVNSSSCTGSLQHAFVMFQMK